MRILKEGRLPTETVWCGVCSYCRCEIEAMREECREIESDSMTRRERAIVRCPTVGCNQNIEVLPQTRSRIG